MDLYIYAGKFKFNGGGGVGTLIAVVLFAGSI